MTMPKQKPVKPAPLMSPNCWPVKPNSAPQLARMPPRIAAPTPAARIAAKPPYKSRLAFGVIPFPVPLLIGFLFGFYGLTFGAALNNGFRFVTAPGLVV